MQNITIQISGKVYKVGFRYFIKQMAEKLDVAGCVKYSPDHKVIVEASGSKVDLDQLIGYCRLGCFGSDVENISVSENNNPHKNSFDIQFNDKLNKTITKTAKK